MLIAILFLVFASAQATYYRRPTYYRPPYNRPAPPPPPTYHYHVPSTTTNQQQCSSASLSYISRYLNIIVPMLCPRIRDYCPIFRSYSTSSTDCQVRFRAQRVVDICCPAVVATTTAAAVITGQPTTEAVTTQATTTQTAATATHAAVTDAVTTPTAAITTPTAAAITTTTAAATTTTTAAVTTTAQSRPCGQSTISPASRSAMLETIKLTLRIVGGTTATECEYPWIAKLEIGGYLCGGSIIDSTHILTAAHCLHEMNVNDVSVTVGDHDMRSNSGKEQTISANSMTLHENYDPDSFENDIAVIELDQPIQYNDCVSPICIPDTPVATSTECTVAGWGTTSEGGSVSAILQEVDVPAYSANDCLREFPGYGDLIHSTTVCAGYATGGRDACQGDSGGPLMCPNGDQWEVAGVVSSGYGCARENYPGLYTDVASYKDWISNNV